MPGSCRLPGVPASIEGNARSEAPWRMRRGPAPTELFGPTKTATIVGQEIDLRSPDAARHQELTRLFDEGGAEPWPHHRLHHDGPDSSSCSSLRCRRDEGLHGERHALRLRAYARRGDRGRVRAHGQMQHDLMPRSHRKVRLVLCAKPITADAREGATISRETFMPWFTERSSPRKCLIRPVPDLMRSMDARRVHPCHQAARRRDRSLGGRPGGVPPPAGCVAGLDRSCLRAGAAPRSLP